MDGKTNPVLYGRTLRNLRRLGVPHNMAKQAAYQSTVPVNTLPELTSPLGVKWLAEQKQKQIKG